VTTGALYHHFPTKAALFEAVFEQVHRDIMAASGAAAAAAPDEVEFLARAFEVFLDAILEPAAQRILITDAPAVLGLARFTDLDERFAFAAIADRLRAARDAGRLRADDPDTLARLFLGALTRGSMLIAGSDQPKATRDEVARAVRVLLQGLTA
jgi:AcrR family transcriptional regulator